MAKKILTTFLVFCLARLWLPEPVLAATFDPNFCAPADEGGYYNPVYSMSYDYGPDGLVRFYYDVSSDWGGVYVGVLFFNADCVNQGGATHGHLQISGTGHILARAVLQPDNPDAYYFDIEDRDTGNSFGQIWPTFTGNFKADSIVSIFFGYGYYGGVWAQSAGVRVKSVNTPKTPILIVPGVLGTDLYKGNDLLWANLKMMDGFDGFMDPLGFNEDLSPMDNSIALGAVIREKSLLWQNLDYTQGLISNLIPQGYTEGANLFTFPYDWRFGVSDGNVLSLKGQIDYILNLTHADKVNVVAHSTGGLLVKKYVMDNPSSHHIGKAVFVGVPNLGAPLALKVLTVGDSMGVPGFDSQEFKKIGHNMPVVYDLLPSPAYYQKLGSFFHISDPAARAFNDQERDMDYEGAVNNLIESDLLNPLGVSENKNLHTSDFDDFDVRTAGVEAYNLVGCKTATLGKFTEAVDDNGFGDFSFPQITAGDDTVPFGSADSILADADKTFFAPKVGHSSLLSRDGPSQQIVNILAGTNLDIGGNILSYNQVSQDPSLCSMKGEYLSIFSPVQISATDNLGNKDVVADDGSLQNDIPGAIYQIWDGHKFMFLPTDSGQQYKISLKGAGTGPAIIKEQTIDGDSVVGTQVFANIPVTPKFGGQLNLPGGNSTTTTISLDSSLSGAPNLLYPSAVIGAAASQDIYAPIATSSIAGIKDGFGNYKDYAAISLSGSDAVVPGQESQSSGLLGIEYSLDNGPYQLYAGPVTVSSEGRHSLSFYAIDKAGNAETVQSVAFSLKGPAKTQPQKCCGHCC